MEFFLINNGKYPDDTLNASLGFWLPPDSPYGNFQLKFFKIIQRLDEANRRIIESYDFWQSCKTPGFLPPGAVECHTLANEQAIYMMRKAADELVSLISCLSEYEKNSKYPEKMKIDCIGAVLNRKDEDQDHIYGNHLDFMQLLNEIANAYKHSFVNSELTLVGIEEPRINALALKYNNLSSSPTFHDVSFSELIVRYNGFYEDCVAWLNQFSERNRP